jgi:hypothetical protein
MVANGTTPGMKILFLFLLMTSILLASRHGTPKPALRRRRANR